MKDLSCVPEEYQRPEWRWDTLVEYRPWWLGSYLCPSRKDRSNPLLPRDAEGCIEWPYTPINADNNLLDLAKRDAICAAFDEKYPIPFPGFRVGQIWGVDTPGGFVVSDPLTHRMLWWAKPAEMISHSSMGGIPSVGRRLCPPEYNRLFDVSANVNACPVFLLHDPLRPSAVPWSGYFPLTDLEGVFR